MLRNDEAWHYLEHFADALQWARLELFCQHRADGSGGYQPGQPVDTARRDNDLVKFTRHAGSVGRWGTGASRYGSQKGGQHGGRQRVGACQGHGTLGGGHDTLGGGHEQGNVSE
jgi:hypothetical protein